MKREYRSRLEYNSEDNKVHINEENVGENFIYFDNDYKKDIKRLDALRENMILLHKRVKNF